MNLTKKIIGGGIAALALCSLPLAVHATSEGDLFDFLDSLAEATSFGYGSSQEISVSNNTETTITIESPVIADDLGTVIKNYTLQYSTEPSLELIEDSRADEIKKKDYNFPSAEGTIEFTLTVGKEIEADTMYYVSLIPQNADGFPGTVSNEISFRLADLIAEEQANEPAPTTNPEPTNNNTDTHSTAPDMCAANISYVQDNNNVTVTWDAIDPSARVNIYLRHASERDFRKIATANISAEEYSFVATRNGTHYIKMEPIDSNGKSHGKECVQTLRLKDFTETTIPVAPKNGPETTILLLILGITLFGYLTYRRRQMA